MKKEDQKTNIKEKKGEKSKKQDGVAMNEEQLSQVSGGDVTSANVVGYADIAIGNAPAGSK